MDLNNEGHNEITELNKQSIHIDKIAHMVGVAEYMLDRASDYGIDSGTAYTAGLLHDIGYLNGRVGHEETGAEILKACGMHGDIVFATASHASELKRIPKEQISPILVLMIEADLSVDAKGSRVGFDKRCEDIAKRYGIDKTKNDNVLYKNVLSNIEYIKNYQVENGIPNQEVVLNR